MAHVSEARPFDKLRAGYGHTTIKPRHERGIRISTADKHEARLVGPGFVKADWLFAVFFWCICHAGRTVTGDGLGRVTVFGKADTERPEE